MVTGVSVGVNQADQAAGKRITQKATGEIVVVNATRVNQVVSSGSKEAVQSRSHSLVLMSLLNVGKRLWKIEILPQ